ncbi:hypothetical protein J2TS4_12280 [Paenibacillus sp. J2TS4]|nr:hypothetical protein J2TS4_12280 [Paenibacillus sp. J2TS4]
MVPCSSGSYAANNVKESVNPPLEKEEVRMEYSAEQFGGPPYEKHELL